MNRRKAVFLASLWCGTGVYACKEDVPLDPVQLDPRAVAVAEYGDLETGNVLGLVQDASLSPTGRYLAILDRDEPHLWVFDRELDTTHVFGRHGAGPGEIQSPMSITFLGDSVIAVLRYGAIDLFSPEGVFQIRIHLSELGVRAQAITDGCNGLVMYGTSQEESRDPVPHWLHRVDILGGEIHPVAFLEMGGRSAVGWGGLEGLDGSDSEVLLWHRPHTTETGWTFSCASETARLLEERQNEVEVRNVLLADRSGGQILRLPDTLFAGAVAHHGTFVVGHTARSETGSANQGHTLLRSWGPGGTGCVAAPGRWLVFDANADLLVLAVRDPFPQVFLVPFDSVGGEEVTGRPCG